MTERCTNFEEMLAAGGVLVADGAMGTTLFSLGLEGGGCPELLNVERPELVEEVHARFVEAGADIILTNTFGGNERRLRLHGLQNRVEELNAAAVARARRATAASGRQVAIAGSIGPTGDLFEPLGPLTHDEGVAVFRRQGLALAEAGVDVLWIIVGGAGGGHGRYRRSRTAGGGHSQLRHQRTHHDGNPWSRTGRVVGRP